MSLNRKTSKQTVVHPYHGNDAEIKQTIDTQNNLGGSQGQKPSSKGHFLDDSSHITFSK